MIRIKILFKIDFFLFFSSNSIMTKNHEITEFWISQKDNWFIANPEARNAFDEYIKSKYNTVYQAVAKSFRLPIFTYSMSNTQYRIMTRQQI